jgi:UDP-GlcNAc:undecaprenyl-phosphate GlcNAc-1-phosphate transferase
LFWIAVSCGVTSIGALVSVYMQNEVLALMSAAVVGATLMATRVFGFAELMLLTNRLLAFGGSLVATQRQPGMVRQHKIQLQGSRNWDEIWEVLTDFAERHALHRMRLDLNVPWLHEGYNGIWERTPGARIGELWSTMVPITARGRTLGKLEIVGPVNRDCFQLLGLIGELLESLQPSMDRLSAEIPRDKLDMDPTPAQPTRPAQSKLASRIAPHKPRIGAQF